MAIANTPTNVRILVGASGLHPLAAAAWLACEGSGPEATDPLNIRHTGAPHVVAYDARGFARFDTVSHGLEAAVWILHNVPGAGYGNVLRAIATHDPLAQAHALEASSWAAGHYGYVCLTRYVRARWRAPAPARRTHVVVSGDTLWGLAVHYYGHGYLFVRIAIANRIVSPWRLAIGRRLIIP